MTGPLIQASIRFALGEQPRVLSVSEGTESLLGIPKDDFVSSAVNLRDLVHSGDADVLESLFTAAKKDESGSFNIRLRHVDGLIRCVRGDYSKTPKRKGEPPTLDLLLQDAKSLWKPQTDESISAHFQALMENTDDFIFFKDRNHVFTGASNNILKPMGLKGQRSSILGLTDYDVFPEKYADIYYRLEKEVYGGVPVASEVHESLKPDGRLAWLDNHKYPIRNDSGEIIGLIGVVRDITEHMMAQQALADAERKYRAIFDGSVEGIVRTTIDGRVIVVNEAAATILGYKSTEDALASIENVARDVWANSADRKSYMRALIEDKNHAIHDFECRFKRKNGSSLWVSLSGRLVYGDDWQPAYHDGFFVDITQRKKAEQALRDREESLRRAQSIAGLGSYVGDLKTGDWKSSAVLDEIFGIGKDYARTKEGWAALVHPDDRERMVAYFTNEILIKKESFRNEYRIVRHSDGAVRWLQDRGSVELDDQGQPVKMRGIARDITETKLFEEALRDSAESLRESQRIAGLGSYVLDIASGVWTSSDVQDQIFGIDKDFERDVTGWTTLIHPGDRDMMAAYFANDVLEKKKPFDREYRIVRRSDGATRWVHGLGRLELNAQGRPVKMLGTILDITEKRLNEAVLRESKDLLQLFIESAPVALAMFDREMRYLTVSHRWAKDHGLAAREMIGQSHYDVSPDVRDRWKETHRRGLAGERLQSDEDRFVRADGKIQWIRWEIIPWQAGDGTVGGIIMFYEDITERKHAEAALRVNTDLLEMFIKRAPAALAMFDREMRYLHASERWIEDYCLVGREIIGHSHYEIVPDIPERWKQMHQRGLAGETLRADEDPFEHADGSIQWIRWEIMPWRTGTGEVGGIILFAEDISHQKESAERLRLAASVFTNAREGILITDPNGKILEVNEMFTRITGYTREEALGGNPRMLKSGLQSSEFYSAMWNSLLEEGSWSGELWNRNKNGDVYAETLTINAVQNAEGKVLQYVALFSDVTELKEHERQLDHVIHYDLLTSLPNRALLADRLRQAMSLPSLKDRLLAVAYLDLDNFREINDRYGHSAGDRLLTSLAFNMKCALRKGDTLARLGGDEFVAVLLDLNDVEASIPVLNRLLEAAAEPVQVGDSSLHLTASVGVAFYAQKDNADADSLLRQADQAMYQAKLTGGNRYHIYDPDHDELVRGRHENLEHIRHALAAREFVLYYQPKVNMRTGKVVGAEALIRWQHPQRGLLPPGMFLPVIEDDPLSVELGEWVIDTALTQIETWRAAGLEIPVSVNVGALQLQQTDFVDRLRTMMAAHPGVKPLDLELEVLETSALQDVAQTSQVLKSCSKIGVAFALDDFGTGYSSLTYLKRLPVNMLKIDQSFVSDMLEDPENLNILEGVLGLASAFRRGVIAEGVETVEHGLMLLQLGCDLAQGYGIARPMEAGDLIGWVRAWRPDPRWAKVPFVNPGNRALLYACVEHRAWIAAFEAYLQGKRHAPPTMDEHKCRLGMWLEAEEQAGRNKEPNYQSVETKHRRFHGLAANIFSSIAAGRSSEGLQHLGELHNLRDSLLEQLEILQQQY